MPGGDTSSGVGCPARLAALAAWPPALLGPVLIWCAFSSARSHGAYGWFVASHSGPVAEYLNWWWAASGSSSRSTRSGFASQVWRHTRQRKLTRSSSSDQSLRIVPAG